MESNQINKETVRDRNPSTKVVVKWATYDRLKQNAVGDESPDSVINRALEFCKKYGGLNGTS